MAKVCCRSILVVAFCVLLFCRTSVAISRPTSIVLENNEYKNILVAIDDSVDDDPTLIQTIKDTFTKASAFLYSATNQRAVFRDVTILVPARWSNNNDAYASATTQVFNNADIIFARPIAPAPPPTEEAGRARRASERVARANERVARANQREPRSSDPVPTSSFDHQPAMTKMYAGCGHPGVRITMTTDILTDRRVASTVGPAEKVLVHEWAHFRWGVFDEYALDDEPQFYFSPSTGQLEGVRCTEIIKGILSRINPATGKREYCRDLDPSTGLYPVGCKFLPYPAGPLVVEVEASIMDHLTIRPMSKFCDDNKLDNATKHNYDAPSRHNRLCGHRSTWDVISTSEDFSNGANSPRQGVDTAPVFTVVQASTARRLVLALDTSQSMAEDQKLTRMKQAVATFVLESVAPATELGLTTFSDEPHVQRALQALNTSEDRQTFADDLPDTQSGATDITLGLTTAAKLLKDPLPTEATESTTTPISLTTANDTSLPPSEHSGQSGHLTPSRQAQRGGHVVVVTDGHETSGMDVMSALPLLREAGVVVSFVVLGGPPSTELEHLAQSTGGRVYCDSNVHSSTAATDAFFDMLGSLGTASSASPVQILSKAEAVPNQHSLKGAVYVDEDLGNKTTFLVAYDVTIPTVRVTSPSGRVYSEIYPEYSLDHRLQLAKILIPGKAEPGKWTYEITNTGNYQRIYLLVLSSPANTSVPPVHVSGTLMLKKHSSPTKMRIFAEATRGETPVTGLRVTALVNTPDGTSVKMELMDNGAGADIVEHDGVYSRFFSKMTQPGLYTVQLTATGHRVHNDSDSVPMDPRNRFVQRSASAGYIVIRPNHNTKTAHASPQSGTTDEEAPVRISDLRVVKTSSKNRTVVLSWTASGDDTDRDTASHYEVFMAPTAYDLMTGTIYVTNLTQSDIIHGNLVAPKPFGKREFYMVRIPRHIATTRYGGFVFTVVAVDEAGNRGEHSNYVTVGLGRVPDVTDKRYWRDGRFQAATAQLDAPKDQKLLIAGILGTVSGLLVLVIVAALVVSFFSRNSKNDVLRLPVYRRKSGSEVWKGKKNIFAMS